MLYHAIRDILMLLEKYFMSGKNLYLDPFFKIFKHFLAKFDFLSTFK